MAERSDFDEYVAARSARLHQMAYLLTRDWASAEDLVQAALVKGWFAWRRIEGDPDPYVRRIVVTTYTSWRRRRWTREVATGYLPDKDAGQPDAATTYGDRDVLWRALGDLTPRQRAVVVLRYFEDLSQQQTAEVLGLQIGTVRSLTARAMVALRGNRTLSNYQVT